MSPRSFAGYAILDTLGRGGMGEVFRAKHELLERPVALKRLVLPPTVRDSEAEQWRERFVREGRALAKLQHENLVAVYDLFESRRELYLALELVDGFPAGDLLRGGALPPDIVCLVGIGVARALEAAHRSGILHRDVKPANIMLSRGGVVKLMDFGIARDIALDTLTQTGDVVGTPQYLAPERVRGEPAGVRADLYALGATLYELISGRRLFAHASADNLWPLVAQGKYPRLAKVAPHTPWRLILIIERCLKTDPKRRFASASELKQALERFLATHGGPADTTARLVGYLVAVGRLAEQEAMTVVHDTAIVPIEAIALRPRSPPWRTVALVNMLVCTILGAAFALETGACVDPFAGVNFLPKLLSPR